MTNLQAPAALVTGGAIRLGKHIALALAAQGYDIALHYNSSVQAAEETADLIRQLGRRCECFSCNLGEVQAIPDLIKQAKFIFPNLNVLVNSASAYTQARISETTLEVFDAQFAINIRAPFFLSQSFAYEVKSGNIINIIDNKIGFNQFQYAAYLLAKKTLVEFTRMAALEFAPHIRVNGVAPGVVLPASTRSEEYIEWRKQSIPLKMQGTPDNITKAIISLLDNDFMSGQILVVDGAENIAHIGKNAGDFDPSKI
ncbi:MAG: SDR family oxidoreductase [Saprospiraceae bacterium]|nr:SDR family oxidoreductase [Saprospiraceae bacterium]